MISLVKPVCNESGILTTLWGVDGLGWGDWRCRGTGLRLEPRPNSQSGWSTSRRCLIHQYWLKPWRRNVTKAPAFVPFRSSPDFTSEKPKLTDFVKLFPGLSGLSERKTVLYPIRMSEAKEGSYLSSSHHDEAEPLPQRYPSKPPGFFLTGLSSNHEPSIMYEQ